MSTKTNSRLAHHTFSPWRVDGDRRIVAGEREWDAVKGLDIVAQHMHQTRRVVVGVDVFEGWEGAMEDEHGTCFVNEKPVALSETVDFVPIRPASMQDVRLRLFRTIDACPNLDWLLFTSTPENVLATLERMSNRLSLVDCWLTGVSVPNNIWMGTDIDDQATADERIPHLLRVPAAVRMVRYSGVGKVSLSPYLNDAGEVVTSQGVDCDWLIISGEVGPNARPCNLEHVRDAIRQCKAAGVPVWVERLGSCVVGRYHERLLMVGESPRGIDCPVRWILSDPDGSNPTEWPEDLRIREVPSC